MAASYYLLIPFYYYLFAGQRPGGSYREGIDSFAATQLKKFTNKTCNVIVRLPAVLGRLVDQYAAI